MNRLALGLDGWWDLVKNYADQMPRSPSGFQKSLESRQLNLRV